MKRRKNLLIESLVMKIKEEEEEVVLFHIEVKSEEIS
jgi:hypothetical protein